jgi:hypothetical protein
MDPQHWSEVNMTGTNELFVIRKFQIMAYLQKDPDPKLATRQKITYQDPAREISNMTDTEQY